jgi:isopentenyl-diphosphate Delta-isomerase
MNKKNSSKTAIQKRKSDHINICLGKHEIENYPDSCYGYLRFIHNSLTEVSPDEIDTSMTFLDHRISMPLFISCMTGGTKKGAKLNRMLASAAQETKIPLGIGSIRILLEDEENFRQFHLKKIAGDVPVVANIGIMQLKKYDHKVMIELLKRLEVQALAVHLNPAQELMQPEGDRDFHSLSECLKSFCDNCRIPVIVKETGMGIKPSLVPVLFGLGASYIDLAGSGGTDWVKVESFRKKGNCAELTGGWGIPTAVLQSVVGSQGGRIMASGGIRSGGDVAKSLALGAIIAGAALPFLKAVHDDGIDGAVRLVGNFMRELKNVMCLTGVNNPKDLASVKLMRDREFIEKVDELKKADEIS